MKIKYYSLFLTLGLVAQGLVAQILVPYRVGDEWGYADTSRQVVIAPQYTAVGRFAGDPALAWVYNGAHYGYLNSVGDTVLPFHYVYAKEVNASGQALVKLDDDGAAFCLNYRGQRVPCAWGGGDTPNPGMRRFTTYQKDGKIGLVTNGHLPPGPHPTKDTLPAIWDDWQENRRGLAAVKQDDQWALMGSTGNLLTPYVYDSIIFCKKWLLGAEQLLFVQDGKFGCMRKDGQVVVPAKYHLMEPFDGRLAKVWLDARFWGYIDEKGRAYFRRE